MNAYNYVVVHLGTTATADVNRNPRWTNVAARFHYQPPIDPDDDGYVVHFGNPDDARAYYDEMTQRRKFPATLYNGSQIVAKSRGGYANVKGPMLPPGPRLMGEAASNPELDQMIRKWSETKARIAEMKASLKEMEDEATGAESMIVQVMEAADETVRRVDLVTVTIKKKLEGGRVSYKEGLTFLLGKVNDQLKQMADEFLEQTKGGTWTRKWLQKESVDEGMMKRVWDALRSMLGYFSSWFAAVNKDISALEEAADAIQVSESAESLNVKRADALLG